MSFLKINVPHEKLQSINFVKQFLYIFKLASASGSNHIITTPAKLLYIHTQIVKIK